MKTFSEIISLIFALGPCIWLGLLYFKILSVPIERALKVGLGNPLSSFITVLLQYATTANINHHKVINDLK